MLHNIKPIPRFIIIAIIVGGVGFGLSKINLGDVLPKEKVIEATSTVTPKDSQQSVETPHEQQVQSPVATPPALQSAPINSGLTAVIEAGQK
jgi:hypothetical protein